jgi:hypothetical protein
MHQRAESRVFPAFAAIALPVILALLPARYQLMPRGIPLLLSAALAIPMLAAGFAPENAFLTRLERYAIAIILSIGTAIELTTLALLLRDMARVHPEMGGLTLLTSSIAIWTTNVLVFAIAYWQLDRGGPAARSARWKGRADSSFPRGEPGDGVPADWSPTFPDYLALAFNTSAAFSPTDVLPLTPRAKMLMVLQSVIALITVIAVGARAINILAS